MSAPTPGLDIVKPHLQNQHVAPGPRFVRWAFCLLNGHAPRRTAIGGFRCMTCGRPGADLAEYGLDSHVDVTRSATLTPPRG